MVVMGCDIGTSATKIIIMKDGTVAGYGITPTGDRPDQAIERSIDKVLSNTGISLSDIAYCGATGWGTKFVSLDHSEESLIKCLSKGAHWAVPTARTVVDVGGLSSTAISVNEKGKPMEYRLNDKCASGSGRFLEMVAEALELKVEDMGPLSLSAKERVHITSQCAVFGESEVIAHVNAGREVADIVAGVTYSVGLGLSTLAKRLGVQRDCVITGGVAKNVAVVKALEENIGVEVKVPHSDPQIICAIGAALCAQERLKV
ncbi:MAG: 2-hydroxyglutaryl-CoA dehydratase [archaeon]|nr:2-hydroxyglutaryl-CoA dehydratase [archaeon]